MAGLQRHSFEYEMWTFKKVAEHIRRKYDAWYVPHMMQQLMHDTGFLYVKPRPKHPKSASNEEKSILKKSQTDNNMLHQQIARFLYAISPPPPHITG